MKERYSPMTVTYANTTFVFLIISLFFIGLGLLKVTGVVDSQLYITPLVGLSLIFTTIFGTLFNHAYELDELENNKDK